MTINTEMQVKDFRAIHHADILLNGITVIAGINGSGKSTLSKLLYSAFENTNRLEDIYIAIYQKSLTNITEIYQQIKMAFPKLEPLRTFIRNLYEKGKRDKARELLVKALDTLRSAIIHDEDNEMAKRIRNIIEYNLNVHGTIDEVLQSVLTTFDSAEEAREKNMANRPIKELDAAMADEFDENSLLEYVSLSEYGVPFFDKKVSKVPILHYIKNTTYIDSPLAINFSERPYRHDDWKRDSLDEKLRMDGIKDYNKDIYSYISRDIIKGEALLSENMEEIYYTREDGQAFALQDCATGVKSFAMLQMLLRNGHINDRSLIIIDEPEAHLHPQWIVEYAKVVVELNKQVGAKFFIATHSTDMVSALRYIAEKEKTLDKLAYYNAVVAKDAPYMFDYKPLGIDIEPIFESFNKSFSLIEKYGEDNGEV